MVPTVTEKVCGWLIGEVLPVGAVYDQMVCAVELSAYLLLLASAKYQPSTPWAASTLAAMVPLVLVRLPPVAVRVKPLVVFDFTVIVAVALLAKPGESGELALPIVKLPDEIVMAEPTYAVTEASLVPVISANEDAAGIAAKPIAAIPAAANNLLTFFIFDMTFLSF